MTDRDFEELRRLHDRVARHHAAGERQPYFKLDREVHLAIVAASKRRGPAGDPLAVDVTPS
jgi:DNA-binding GntR family transcriptional regulator